MLVLVVVVVVVLCLLLWGRDVYDGMMGILSSLRFFPLLLSDICSLNCNEKRFILDPISFILLIVEEACFV